MNEQTASLRALITWGLPYIPTLERWLIATPANDNAKRRR